MRNGTRAQQRENHGVNRFCPNRKDAVKDKQGGRLFMIKDYYVDEANGCKPGEECFFFDIQQAAFRHR